MFNVFEEKFCAGIMQEVICCLIWTLENSLILSHDFENNILLAVHFWKLQALTHVSITSSSKIFFSADGGSLCLRTTSAVKVKLIYWTELWHQEMPRRIALQPLQLCCSFRLKLFTELFQNLWYKWIIQACKYVNTRFKNIGIPHWEIDA